jgi:hypothetical protein
MLASVLLDVPGVSLSAVQVALFLFPLVDLVGRKHSSNLSLYGLVKVVRK